MVDRFGDVRLRTEPRPSAGGVRPSADSPNVRSPVNGCASWCDFTPRMEQTSPGASSVSRRQLRSQLRLYRLFRKTEGKKNDTLAVLDTCR